MMKHIEMHGNPKCIPPPIAKSYMERTRLSILHIQYSTCLIWTMFQASLYLVLYQYYLKTNIWEDLSKEFYNFSLCEVCHRSSVQKWTAVD